MQAGDADVVQAIDGVAHDLGGHRGLFGDGRSDVPAQDDQYSADGRAEISPST